MSGSASEPARGHALTTLSGVGPARAAALARLGLACAEDLLRLLPRRLERTGERVTTRAAATLHDQEVAVLGTLRGLRLFRAGRRRAVLALDLVDESGALRVLLFNQPWRMERLRALAAAGRRVELVGRMGRAREGPALLSPRVIEDPPETRVAELVPLYPAVAGIGQERLRAWIGEALDAHASALHDPLPRELLERLGLPRLGAALEALHRPAGREAYEGARRRLVLERLLALQARLARVGTLAAERSARALHLDAAARAELERDLPFEPTAGQRRVLDEILGDLARTRPMRRLLQGDVGAGKTLVALLCCAAVARAGGQAALLVPTELLCEQHHLGLGRALERFGLRTVVLTGSARAAQRKAVLSELRSGRAQLAIGTHALFSPGVEFRRLDLCVIDEQQRFGVAQKQALLEKGADVHALLMTATPIPRTLALCYYGDLETSLLRERPPGRARIETRVLDVERRDEVVGAVLARTATGERAFWVCPRILGDEEEDDGPSGRESRAARASAERIHAWLSAGPLADRGLGLLHGRLAPAERARTIERFRAGELRVLVATSMVEVGVDVPEATVMVVDGAERFGLAQLHQLRGRVGRSSRPSQCHLLAPREALERLAFLAQCDDGFVVADEDLRRRGMGDLAGLRQAGENLEGLGAADLDLELVRCARQLVRADPELQAHYLGLAARAPLV